MISGRPVIVRVRCSGRTHRIRWEPSKIIEGVITLVLLDHDPDEVASWDVAVALAGEGAASVCRCHEVLQDWQKAIDAKPYHVSAKSAIAVRDKLPKSLKEASLIVWFLKRNDRAVNTTSKKESN